MDYKRSTFILLMFIAILSFTTETPISQPTYQAQPQQTLSQIIAGINNDILILALAIVIAGIAIGIGLGRGT